MAETPFKIAIPDERIERLKQKLALTDFPDELENSGWEYGVPLADVRRLIARWKDGYDWRKHEAELNEELPQFTRDIDVEGFGTLNIHYIHKKSDIVDAIPLLFIHGCKLVLGLSCALVVTDIFCESCNKGQEVLLKFVKYFLC